jgi:hypothetical protein
MSHSLGVYFLVALSLLLANTPFLTRRILGIVKVIQPKSLGLRLLELVFFYGVVGGVGLLLEQSLGQIAPQGWEFYAITGTLFVTLAFPGFVYRYLLKHSS